MNRWCRVFHCDSKQQLYSTLKGIAIYRMGLDGVPFTLESLEQIPDDTVDTDMSEFMDKCAKVITRDNSDEKAIKLVKFLKDNPPKESFENPKVSDSETTKDEIDLIQHIFSQGIDLPGSTHNPFGHLQNFSSFFIDMFFGNYTEFYDFVKNLSKVELEKAMERREGYCQFNPIFAPILGLKMVDIETTPIFTTQQTQEIRSMYTGCNENEHLKILKKLIELGADVHAHDIYGFTPLHYAVMYCDEGMVTLLLEHGVNPNSEGRDGWTPLSCCAGMVVDDGMRMIDILIQHSAKVKIPIVINELRNVVETVGSKELAARVREAHPRENNVCEKCLKHAPKMCSACGLVYYCSPVCQKLDWKFHKITCHKSKKN